LENNSEVFLRILRNSAGEKKHKRLFPAELRRIRRKTAENYTKKGPQ